MQDYILSLHSVTVHHYVLNLVCVQLPIQAFCVIAFEIDSFGHFGLLGVLAS